MMEAAYHLESWNQGDVSIPIKMDGTRNFRDLGGYPAEGGITRKGSFFRSDALTELSEADRAWMKQHGITCVLDLRSRKEMETAPDRLSPSFDYHAISMSDRMNDNSDGSEFPDSLSDLYIQILNNHKEEFRTIAGILAGREGKPAVFHCAVGKDRTGVTAMLLLLLAGVPEEIILQDYAVSEKNMKETFEKQKEMLRRAGWNVPELLFQSPVKEMERTIRYLNEHWGSAQAYLEDCGVSRLDVERLKLYLVERDGQ